MASFNAANWQAYKLWVEQSDGSVVPIANVTGTPVRVIAKLVGVIGFNDAVPVLALAQTPEGIVDPTGICADTALAAYFRNVDEMCSAHLADLTETEFTAQAYWPPAKSSNGRKGKKAAKKAPPAPAPKAGNGRKVRGRKRS